MPENKTTAKAKDLITVVDGGVRMNINLPDVEYIGFTPDVARRVAAHLVAAAHEAEGGKATHTVTMTLDAEAKDG